MHGVNLGHLIDTGPIDASLSTFRNFKLKIAQVKNNRIPLEFIGGNWSGSGSRGCARHQDTPQCIQLSFPHQHNPTLCNKNPTKNVLALTKQTDALISN